MRCLMIFPVLALACGQKSLDLQAAPHITRSADPTVVGTIDEQVGPIAVDAERLYWMGSQAQQRISGGTALRSCKKEDCAGSLVTYDAGEAELSFGFGVQNGRIYWFHFLGYPASSPWSIQSCDVSGCAAETRTLPTEPNLDSPSYPTAYASDAIYSSTLSLDGISTGLYRIPLTGNAAPVAVATAAGQVLALGIHGDYLYWAEGPAAQLIPPCTLRRVRTSGDATPETLANNVEIVRYESDYAPFPALVASVFAFDSSYLYWNQGTLDGAIDRCPLTGCSGAPEVVVAPIHSPLALLVDGSKAYWVHDTRSQGFAVSGCTIGDCASPDLITFDMDGSNALALDDQYLYTATTDRALDSYVPWHNPVVQIRRFLR
jgi:hypothetical protein